MWISGKNRSQKPVAAKRLNLQENAPTASITAATSENPTVNITKSVTATWRKSALVPGARRRKPALYQRAQRTYRKNQHHVLQLSGQRLADDLEDGYFAIGTDARITTFNSQTDDGFTETTAQNKNSLNALAGSVEGARYYMDLKKALAYEGWEKLLGRRQRITSLNVGSLTLLKMFYTSKIVPKDTFDGMIIFDQVGPRPWKCDRAAGSLNVPV